MKVVSRNLRIRVCYPLCRFLLFLSVMSLSTTGHLCLCRCSLLLVGTIVSLHAVVAVLAGDHLLLLVDGLLVILTFVVTHVLLIELLLFGMHLLHGAAIFSLLIDRLHVVPWREHFVTAHSASTSTHATPLLTFPFALLTSALI